MRPPLLAFLLSLALSPPASNHRNHLTQAKGRAERLDVRTALHADGEGIYVDDV